MNIYTDRSRISVDANDCARRRYYEYEALGTGVVLEGDNTSGRDIGSCVHAGIDYALKILRDGTAGPPSPEFAIAAAHAAPEFPRLDREDDQDMVDALVRTWFAVVLPQLAAGWRVEDCEREELFSADVPERGLMRCEVSTVNFMSRLDLLARATDTATLNGSAISPGLWIWDWKCIKRGGDMWRRRQRYEMQWLTSLLGPEARLGTRMEGVIVCALIKENHPLVSCWRNRATGETTSRYRYTCTEPHPFRYAKGGMCMGGVQHTLGSKEWEAVPVRSLPGGAAAYYDKVFAEDPDLLREWVDFAGPMMRVSDYEIERWKRQHFRREVEIARVRSAEPLPDEALDRWFPQRTSACLTYAKLEGAALVGACPAHDFCHGGATLENYPVRTEFNHPAEKENVLCQP